MHNQLLAAQGVTKSYFKGHRHAAGPRRNLVWPAVRRLVSWKRTAPQIEVPVLLGVDMEVQPGEFVSIVGPSGCGKSTLLHLLGTLDRPDSGAIFLEGERIDSLPPQARDRLRNEVFGFIFQIYHLLPELTALENVLAPLMIRHGVFSYMRTRNRLRHEAHRLLDRVGLGHRIKHRPNELSGGEMQRAAIARALVGGPRILLADEPTGNLDAATGQAIIELLTGLNRNDGLTVLMVTHDPIVAQKADRIVRLVNGRVETTNQVATWVA